MTKILVMGGAGFQGSRAARMLAAGERVQELVVVDAQRDAAQREAAHLGPKASSACVEATDTAAVASLLRDLAPDLMLNCSGPYRSTGLSSLDAAIECGVDYVDLLDDKDLIGSYLGRDERALAAGVTAICCTGWTPGLTNIMAAHLATDLDEVEQIHITWLGSVTLHRRFPGLRQATIRGSYTAPEFLDLVRSLGRSGMLERQPIDADGQRVVPEAFIGAFLSSRAHGESDPRRGRRRPGEPRRS